MHYAPEMKRRNSCDGSRFYLRVGNETDDSEKEIAIGNQDESDVTRPITNCSTGGTLPKNDPMNCILPGKPSEILILVLSFEVCIALFRRFRKTLMRMREGTSEESDNRNVGIIHRCQKSTKDLEVEIPGRQLSNWYLHTQHGFTRESMIRDFCSVWC